jgi:hypothetical protein
VYLKWWREIASRSGIPFYGLLVKLKTLQGGCVISEIQKNDKTQRMDKLSGILDACKCSHSFAC